jgi:hypothetical protein
MNLALVPISVPVFQEIRDHLLTYKPRYRNMHLRERCQRDSEWGLRYLHALHASQSTSDVEGMISGPGIFLRYQMSMASRTRIHLRVTAHRSTPQADVRIYRRFLPEIAKRIQEERALPEHHPRLTPGQFYLRRSIPGMHDSHQNCIDAVRDEVLAQEFVSQLHAWNLRLLHPMGSMRPPRPE